MVNPEQKPPPQLSELADYTLVGEYHEQNAGPVFPTRDSLTWFLRIHRTELIKCGALIPREGRAGSLLSKDKFPRAVVKILRRRAQEKLAPGTVGAA